MQKAVILKCPKNISFENDGDLLENILGQFVFINAVAVGKRELQLECLKRNFQKTLKMSL